jgi:hypothetical protein
MPWGRISLRKRGVSALRRRPKGTAIPFGLAAVAAAAIVLAPAQTGYQDLAARVAVEPAVESHRAHLIASTFGTIHAATFSFPQPVGTGLPRLVRLAALDTDLTGSIGRMIDRADIEAASYPDFPQIDRTGKGPRLVPRVRPHFDALDAAKSEEPEEPDEPEGAPAQGAEQPGPPPEAPASEGAQAREGPAPPAGVNAAAELADRETGEPDASASLDTEDAALHAARIYFGASPLGGRFAALEPWAPGEAPIFEEEATVTPVSLPGETPRNETIVAKDRVRAGRIDRSHFLAELDSNPGLITKMASMVYGEVGRTAPRETQMAQLESAFNRAQQRGQSVSHVLLSVAEDPKRGYYASNTYHPVSPKDVERFKTEVLAPVLAGSDLGHGVTGNASGSVAAHQFAKRSQGFNLRAARGTKESYFMEGPITGPLPHFQPQAAAQPE